VPKNKTFTCVSECNQIVSEVKAIK